MFQETDWNEENIKQMTQFISESGLDRFLHEKSRELLSLMSYYKCAMMEVETKLNVLSEEFSIRYDRTPINSIKSRLKSFPSIQTKLRRRGLPLTLEKIENNLFDIAGIRVICSFVDDIYLLADCLLAQDDITLVEIKDYIKHPKENGYRSLHLIVQIPIFLQGGKKNMKVEIQLRTIAMDSWASLEHQLRYKKDHTFTENMQKELLECAEISAMMDARMNQLKRTVFVGNEGKETEEKQ